MACSCMCGRNKKSLPLFMFPITCESDFIQRALSCLMNLIDRHRSRADWYASKYVFYEPCYIHSADSLIMKMFLKTFGVVFGGWDY
jgi:hypothetical protein